MTKYNVHIYREMRLFFPGIEAVTPEQAAAKARELDTADADEITSCDGENLAALVDVVGDEEFTQSSTIDFEAERMRKAGPRLIEALDSLATAAEDLEAAIDGVTDQFDSELKEVLDACQNARTAIAQARGRAA
jgi:hypothetical protein